MTVNLNDVRDSYDVGYTAGIRDAQLAIEAEATRIYAQQGSRPPREDGGPSKPMRMLWRVYGLLVELELELTR